MIDLSFTLSNTDKIQKINDKKAIGGTQEINDKHNVMNKRMDEMVAKVVEMTDFQVKDGAIS